MTLFRIALITAVIALIPWVGNAQSSLPTIKVGLVPSDDITPVLYAARTGMFRKAGFDVQLIPATSGTAVAQAVVGGSYDIGKSSLVSLMNAHLRGLPLYLIAAGGVYDSSAPYAELVVAPDAPYKSGKDLNGKTIGVPALNDLNEVVIDGWVDQHGGDSKTLHYVEIPNSAATAALAEHRIDAYVMLYPPLSMRRKSRSWGRRTIRSRSISSSPVGLHRRRGPRHIPIWSRSSRAWSIKRRPIRTSITPRRRR